MAKQATVPLATILVCLMYECNDVIKFALKTCVVLLCRIFFRLYWFPIKVLYSTAAVSVIVYPGGPFYIPFNIMLTILYIMQVYWFAFIVALIVRVMLGGKVEDIREETEAEEKKEDDGDKNPPATAGGKESEGAGKTGSGTPKTRKRRNKAGTS